MKFRIAFPGLISVLTPAIAFAQNAANNAVPVAMAPVGTVGSAPSEIASFVLSVVALVVAGIALSRTRK